MPIKSSDVRNLRMREGKSWKVIDHVLSPKCKDLNVKMEASKFVLSRIYPMPTENKHEHSGEVTLMGLVKDACN